MVMIDLLRQLIKAERMGHSTLRMLKQPMMKPFYAAAGNNLNAKSCVHLPSADGTV